jgi:hypothetical protein
VGTFNFTGTPGEQSFLALYSKSDFWEQPKRKKKLTKRKM